MGSKVRACVCASETQEYIESPLMGDEEEEEEEEGPWNWRVIVLCEIRKMKVELTLLKKRERKVE
jgi:hypothetical protein